MTSPASVKKILIIDDNQDILRILVTKLELHGFRVVTAKDAISGLIKIKSERPDLILLDIMMPVTDGFEALRRIKSTTETAMIPTLMLTAKRQRADVLRAMNLGAEDYIVKPIDFAKLLEKIQKNLRDSDSADSRQVELLADIPEAEAPPEAEVAGPEEVEEGAARSEAREAGTSTTIQAGSFRLRTSLRRGVMLLEMEGDLDREASERVNRELTDILEFDTKKVLFDVSGLESFYWFKIDNLLGILQHAESQGGDLRLVCRDQENYQTLIRSKIRFPIVRALAEGMQMFEAGGQA